MKAAGLMIPFLLITALTLEAQQGGEPKIISPYVTGLEALSRDGKIFLTWTDSPDLKGVTYQVYRSSREITRETLAQAELVSSVQEGQETAWDSPPASGDYFYAVLAKDSSGKLWTVFHSYRNKSVAALSYVPPPPEVKSAPDAPTPAPKDPEPPAVSGPPVPPQPPEPAPSPVLQAPPAPPEPSRAPAAAAPAAPAAPALPAAPAIPPPAGPRGLVVRDFQSQESSGAAGIPVPAVRPLALPGRTLGGREGAGRPAGELEGETARILGSFLKSRGLDGKELPALKVFPEEALLEPGTGTQKELHTLVRTHFLLGKWAEGGRLFSSFASREQDRSRQARAYFYAGQSYLKAGDSRNALVNFLQARGVLAEARLWADLLLTPGAQELPLRDHIPLEVAGASEEMLRPLSARTISTATILEESALVGSRVFRRPPVAESIRKSWLSEAEAIKEEAQAQAFEQLLDSAESAGVMDQLVAVLETESSKRDTPPGLHFALSLAYGRQGLIQKAYQAVQTAVRKAAAPGIVFNLAMAYGRRELLGSQGGSGVSALEVRSTPAGAMVRLNGQEVGQAPLKLDGLRPGNHQIEVYRLLYSPKTLTLALGAGDRKEIDVGLAPLKAELTPKEEFSGRGIPEVRVQLGHSGDISAMTFTPDGQKLITGSGDGGIRVWSTKGRIEIQNLPGHFGKITDLQVSPDGRTLGSASWDGTARLWDLETGTQKYLLEGHTNMVNSLDFSPDGKKLVTGGWDNTLRIWDAAAGTQLTQSKPLGAGITDALWSGPKSITALDHNGTLMNWDPELAEVMKTIPKVLEAGEGRLFFDQKRSRVSLLPLQGGAPRNFSPGDLKELGAWEGNYGRFVSTPVNAGGERFLVLKPANQGQTALEVRSYEASSTVLKEFRLPGNLERAILSPDGTLTAASSGRSLHWFGMEKGDSLGQNFPIPGLSDLSVLSPSGDISAIRTQDTAVTLVDAVAGIPSGILTVKSPVTALNFSRRGNFLVIGTLSGTVYLADVKTKNLGDPLVLGQVPVIQILRTGDDSGLLAVTGAGAVHRLNLSTRSAGESFTTLPQVRKAAADQSGTWLAVQSPGNDLGLYDLNTGRPSVTLPKYHSFINDFLFSPDGKGLLLGDNRGRLSYLSLDEGLPAQEIFNFRTPIECLALSGQDLALGTLDSSISLWSLKENRLLKTLAGHLDAVSSLSYDSTGRLLSSGRDRLSIMWNGKSGTHLYNQILNHSDGSYLTWIREGYYTGKGGLEQRVVTVVDRSLIVPLGELAFSYKREDVVAARVQERDILPLLRNP